MRPSKRRGRVSRAVALASWRPRSETWRSGATAAKEIKGLITNSEQKVHAGSGQVTKSGQTLDAIVGSVKQVGSIITEIAAASQEQSVGIDQVNKTVTQMDQIVQANSAQTEKLSSTAQFLTAQATRLQELVLRFKVEEREERDQVVQPTEPEARLVPVALATANQGRAARTPPVAVTVPRVNGLSAAGVRS